MQYSGLAERRKAWHSPPLGAIGSRSRTRSYHPSRSNELTSVICVSFHSNIQKRERLLQLTTAAIDNSC